MATIQAYIAIIDNVDANQTYQPCKIDDYDDIFKSICQSVIQSQIINRSGIIINIIGYKWKEVTGGDCWRKFSALKFVPEVSSPFICIHCDLNNYKDINAKKYEKIIERLYYYCSSSIWNYYYNGAPDHLDIIIQDIERNLDRYQLEIAKEYQELSFRKRTESYLLGGHGDDVVPFLFHSETDIKSKLQTAIGNDGLGFGYKWKVLLVDDHAISGLSGNTDIGKRQIIDEDFERLGMPKTIDSSSNIIIECVTTKEEALKKLEDGNVYDLILLDYLLKNKTDDTVNYGTDILDAIESDGKYKPSPANEYNFMFISAYPTAVQEELLAKGFYSTTTHWFLRRGACPTNTPWMFLYELYRLMNHRIEQLKKHIEIITRNPNTTDSNTLLSPTALSFFSWLYTNGEVRNRAKNSFNAFLVLRATYDKIKYDVYDNSHKSKAGFPDSEKNESLLIRSMFPDATCYSNAFWEHMQHLVYLTAYGTNRQWSEMWEELMSVSKTLEIAESKVSQQNPNPGSEGRGSLVPNNVMYSIRDYILGLKDGKYE